MLRDYATTDLDQVYEMIQKTIAISYPDHYPGRAVQYFQAYHSEANISKRDELGEIIVIEKEGKIVATGSLVKDEITGVFILPAEQKSGLGRQIMLELESRARSKEILTITLHVSLPARKFYEKLNYSLSGQQETKVGDGQHLKYWIGKKRI